MIQLIGGFSLMAGNTFGRFIGIVGGSSARSGPCCRSATAETVDRLFDELDFQRACQVFLRHITASSMYSFREALRRDLGATTPQHYVTWEEPFDATRCC